MDLKDKVAIVTGSGGAGSGRAEAVRLAHEGCFVIVSDIDNAGGAATVAEISTASGKGVYVHADVGDEQHVRAMFDFAERRFGGVDILVNNASAPFLPGAPVETWLNTLNVDLSGAIHCIRYALPSMRRRGGGAIINVGSTSALGHGGRDAKAPAYDTAKAAVTRLTTTLAYLRNSDNIRVNCIVPDWVATPEVKEYWDALTPERRRELAVPDKLTTLDEIAAAVVRLITDETLAGRVLVWWSGKEPGLIPWGDPGYTRLDAYGEFRGSGAA
jgi:NAD(P)-dependent dehydrogenase (short-subunit alcohol dehydrogenase family)